MEDGELPVFSWGNYSGALKRAIAALKYDNQPALGRLLGQELGRAWIANHRQPMPSSSSRSFTKDQATPTTVIPIPIHPTKRKQRGYNQAELIAEGFCAVTGLPLIRHGLKRVKETQAQFGLSVAEREQNLTAAFHLNLPKHGRSLLPRPNWQGSVLIIDDIYTTGATVRAATAVLKSRCINVSGLAVVARPTYGRE